VGAPPKLSLPDLAFIESIAAACAARRPSRSLRILLLGVTPEMAGVRWPRGAVLRAVDRSLPAIRDLWPGNLPRKRAVLCADWRALPLRKSSCDLVVGDGCLSCVNQPDPLRAIAAEARRVLRPDGLLVARSCIVPAFPEGLEAGIAEQRSMLREFFNETPLSAPPQTVKEGCPIFVAAPRAVQQQRNAAGAAAASRGVS